MITGAFIMPHPPIILPEIGRGEEKKLRKTIDACRKAAQMIAQLAPQTIVLTTPHSVTYADYIHISPGERAEGDMGRFSAPGVKLHADCDTAFIAALEEEALADGLAAGTLGTREKTLDHGAMIPLSFVNEQYKNYRLVRVGLSGLSFAQHYRFGMCVRKAAEKLGRSVVMLASGDLSHKLLESGPYGFDAAGALFDQEITGAMAAGDFLRFLSIPPAIADKAAECGLRSFIIMAGALDGQAVDAQLLSYEGPFGVGYGVASFIPKGPQPNRHFLDIFIKAEAVRLGALRDAADPYVRLARLSIERFVKTGKRADLPDQLPEEMRRRRAGVFVSIKKDGQLRGCIGTIAPVTGCIAEEILKNAVSACSEDPRFEAVRPEELSSLVYSVDVLSPPEPIASPQELDVRRYGVIVTAGRRRGLLLPNLEGVDTVQAQIDIARQKAGIRPGEQVSLERFEVVRHT
ncbi:AmmeMemoRadiSam system protein A [Oscillospiraceae bacterium CM]|nr:AmmeMemoRadiSam system protein A [Oscillospiraceae bacterium CM]